MRKRFGIATASQVDVPAVSHRGLLVMVHELAQGQIQATVLNFAEDPVAATVQSACLTPGATVVDLFDEERIAAVDELHSFPISLPAFGGTAVALRS